MQYGSSGSSSSGTLKACPLVHIQPATLPSPRGRTENPFWPPLDAQLLAHERTKLPCTKRVPGLVAEVFGAPRTKSASSSAISASSRSCFSRSSVAARRSSAASFSMQVTHLANTYWGAPSCGPVSSLIFASPYWRPTFWVICSFLPQFWQIRLRKWRCYQAGLQELEQPRIGGSNKS